MEADMQCAYCGQETQSLKQFLDKMVCNKCFHELISSIQVTGTRI